MKFSTSAGGCRRLTENARMLVSVTELTEPPYLAYRIEPHEQVMK